MYTASPVPSPPTRLNGDQEIGIGLTKPYTMRQRDICILGLYMGVCIVM
jgi:hypothetical protein